MRSIDSPRSSDPKLCVHFQNPPTPNSIRCGGANTNAPATLTSQGLPLISRFPAAERRKNVDKME